MSSTVTTATVAAVSSTTSAPEIGGTLTLVAVLVLALGLLAREIVVLSSSRWARAWARGLDIGNAPLLITFALIATMNLLLRSGA